MKYANVSVRMLTGVIGQITLGEQYRQWMLGLLYSAFCKTRGFSLFLFVSTKLQFT